MSTATDRLEDLLKDGIDTKMLAERCAHDALLRRSVLKAGAQLIRAAAHDRLAGAAREKNAAAPLDGYERVVTSLLTAVDRLKAAPSAESLVKSAAEFVPDPKDLIESLTDAGVDLADGFFYFIEFQRPDQTAPLLDLTQMLRHFDSRRDENAFFINPFSEVVTLPNECQYAVDKLMGRPLYFLHVTPSGRVVCIISGKFLTHRRPEYQRVQPRGDLWINPRALVEFTFESCRFAAHSLPAETASKQLTWRAGFRDPHEELARVYLPNERAARDDNYSPYEAAPAGSAWHPWKRPDVGAQAFDVLWTIYGGFRKRQKEIPFCQGKRVSLELLRNTTADYAD